MRGVCSQQFVGELPLALLVARHARAQQAVVQRVPIVRGILQQFVQYAARLVQLLGIDQLRAEPDPQLDIAWRQLK